MPPPAGLSPRTELGLLLRMAHAKAARSFGDALAPLHLEGRHFGVLLTLARLGPVIQSRLISELRSDKSAMVRTVDDLENQGLVTRTPVPGDRRARTVALTDRGRQRLAEGRTVSEEVGAAVFAGLDDADVATLHRLLRRFLDPPG
jgi:MarR family transcriptional regulator, lower aerobic nicotinate degradation pathway regulator